MNTKCAIGGCDRPLHGKIWCQPHYRRNLRTGSPVSPGKWDDPASLFWAHVTKTNDCWLWTGYVTPKGYGRWQSRKLGYEGGIGAHVAAYELLVGPVPGCLVLDHLCRVRHCVRPDHLEPVSRGENVRRGFKLIVACPQGHAYDAFNTYVSSTGNRSCRTCHRERERIRRRILIASAGAPGCR